MNIGYSLGFIGLGNMGWPMAANVVAKGYKVVVNDLSQERVQGFCKQNAATAAASNAELARQSDIVVLMLPTSAADEQALSGSEGALAGMRRNTLVIDMTSGNPSKTKELARKVADAGGMLIDAPVSGGLPRARIGDLSIMVGGEPTALARADPVLKCMGSSIICCGGVGTAHTMKALNNLMSAAGYLIGIETLLIGKKLGLDPATMIDILNVSTGANGSTQRKFKQMVLTRKFDSGFGLDLMVKDLTIAMEIAKDSGTPAPFASLCREVWAAAQQMLGPGHDHTEMALLSEMMAKTELRQE
jgi:3-hydroxyisobutyrate dehydrogenase